MAKQLLGMFLFWIIQAQLSWAKEEVVLTVPVETEVGVAGLRSTGEVWLDLIQNAKSNIDIEHFYLSDEPGESLEPVLKALKDAAKRGVEVRLLLDKKFFATYPEPALSLGKLSHFTFKTIDFEKVAGGVQHAKFMIVDGNRFYVGSANMDWRALKHIHEVGIAGDSLAVVEKLQSVFTWDWGNSALPVRGQNNGNIKVVASPDTQLPAGVSHNLPEILSLLNGANSEIELSVYELSTKVYGDPTGKWTILFDALAQAVARGVTVNVVMDESKFKADEKALANLRAKGVNLRLVRFPTFSGGEIPYARVLHSKFLIVDRKRAWVGTDNWSKNYFYNSRGVGLILNDDAIIRPLQMVFEKLWKVAH